MGHADAMKTQVSNERTTWQSLGFGVSALYVRLSFKHPDEGPKLGGVAEVQLLALEAVPTLWRASEALTGGARKPGAVVAVP